MNKLESIPLSQVDLSKHFVRFVDKSGARILKAWDDQGFRDYEWVEPDTGNVWDNGFWSVEQAIEHVLTIYEGELTIYEYESDIS